MLRNASVFSLLPPLILFLLISSRSRSCFRSLARIDINKNLSQALRKAIHSSKSQREGPIASGGAFCHGPQIYRNSNGGSGPVSLFWGQKTSSKLHQVKTHRLPSWLYRASDLQVMDRLVQTLFPDVGTRCAGLCAWGVLLNKWRDDLCLWADIFMAHGACVACRKQACSLPTVAFHCSQWDFRTKPEKHRIVPFSPDRFLSGLTWHLLDMLQSLPFSCTPEKPGAFYDPMTSLCWQQ